MHHLTRVLACKLATRPNGGHINVNAIAPGLVPTEMTKQLETVYHIHLEQIAKHIPLGRAARPTDLAGMALFLASPAGAWVTGMVMCLDGGQIMGSVSKMSSNRHPPVSA